MSCLAATTHGGSVYLCRHTRSRAKCRLRREDRLAVVEYPPETSDAWCARLGTTIFEQLTVSVHPKMNRVVALTHTGATENDSEALDALEAVSVGCCHPLQRELLEADELTPPRCRSGDRDLVVDIANPTRRSFPHPLLHT